MALLIAFVLFCLLMISLTLKHYTLFVISYIYYVFLYDWLFISIKIYNPSFLGVLLQMSQEIVFVLVLLLGIVRISSVGKFVLAQKDVFFVLCIIIPALFSIIISLKNGDGVSNIITGVRLYFLPIIIPYVLYRMNILSHVKIRYIVHSLSFVAICCMLFGYIQVSNFHGSLSELWFYRGSDIDAIEKASFNFIRDGELRATSFFVSSIMMTSLLAVICVICAFCQKNISRVLTVFCCIYGVYLSRTRVGFLVIALIYGLYFLDSVLKKRGQRKLSILIIVPLFIIAFTFLSIAMGYVTDLSAIGRSVQYLTFFENFQFAGIGIGSEHSLIKYDSFIISIILALGSFSVLYIWYFIDLVKQLYQLQCKFSYSIFLLSLSFIYLFAFQFMAGSVTFRLFFILVFIAISLKNNKCVV